MAISAVRKVEQTVQLSEWIEEEAIDLRREISHAWNNFQEALHLDKKDFLRELHVVAKASAQGIDAHKLLKMLDKYAHYFRPGCLIDPSRIRPKLMLVKPRSKWEDLFKICRASWSMPYSKGYGRRLRFVVFDEYHKAVIGIIGLQSPPADLASRDELFNVSKGNKLDIVNCTLDAYTLGAIPPYSNLLGGKLVASLVSSEDIRRAYWRAYASKRTLIEGKKLLQPLLAVTTTSAFGRSSIYNRLRFQDRMLAEPIGWTKGYGTIHLEGIYPRIEAWLKARNEFIPGGYGNGPKVRWQNITIALNRLGLPAKYAEHGLKREVFLFRHVHNLEEVCKNPRTTPNPIACSTEVLGEFWKVRWAIPRSERDRSWIESTPIPTLREAINSFIQK